MKRFEQLTSQGQVRRIRPMAEKLIALHGYIPTDLRLIHHGENTTFRVKVKETNFLCRIHRPGYQSVESIRSEMILLEHFRDQGLAVPQPLYHKHEAVQLLDGKGVSSRYGVLFHWLPGKFQVRLSANTAKKIGVFMAKMHLAAQNFEAPPSFYRPRLDEKGIWTSMGGDLKTLPISTQKLVQKIRIAFEEKTKFFGRNPDVFGIIHSDFHAGNRLLNQGKVVAIDFDDAGWSWFIFDIAVTMSSHAHQDNYETLLNTFFESYRSIKPLSILEENALSLFIEVRRIQILLWVQGRTDNPSFVARFPKILDHTEKALETFLNHDS